MFYRRGRKLGQGFRSRADFATPGVLTDCFSNMVFAQIATKRTFLLGSRKSIIRVPWTPTRDGSEFRKIERSACVIAPSADYPVSYPRVKLSFSTSHDMTATKSVWRLGKKRYPFLQRTQTVWLIKPRHQDAERFCGCQNSCGAQRKVERRAKLASGTLLSAGFFKVVSKPATITDNKMPPRSAHQKSEILRVILKYKMHRHPMAGLAVSNADYPHNVKRGTSPSPIVLGFIRKVSVTSLHHYAQLLHNDSVFLIPDLRRKPGGAANKQTREHVEET